MFTEEEKSEIISIVRENLNSSPVKINEIIIQDEENTRVLTATSDTLLDNE